MSRVLAERFEVYATHGNLNNHIGVPLTLLAMTRDTEFGVVEMGASACGEIALLASVAEPNYGILTNIGRAHLEGFGGPEGIRRGKGELLDYLAANGGRAFVPREDQVLTNMAAERDGLAAEYYSVTLADGIAHHLEGDYNRFNIAAAVAVGRYFDIDGERIRHAVGSYMPDNNRSQRTETERNTLIVDCYNANPSSMRASVLNFLAEPAGGRSRRVLILGDMLELGAWSEQEHRDIVALAGRNPDTELMLVGGEFARACAGMEPQPANTALFPSREEPDRRTAPPPCRERLRAGKGFARHRAGKGARRACSIARPPCRRTESFRLTETFRRAGPFRRATPKRRGGATKDPKRRRGRNEERPGAEGGPEARKTPERRGAPRRQKAPLPRTEPHRRTRTA